MQNANIIGIMSLDTTALIELALVFSLGIFFSALAVDRRTLTTSLLAALIWMVGGIVNWLFAPTSAIAQGVSYIFWLVGVVFIGLFLYLMGTLYFDMKNKRFETGPM